MSRVTLFITLLFFLPPLFAQPQEFTGKNELSLHGGFDFQGPNGDNIDLEIAYGWFLRDDLLVGGEFQWALLEDIAPGENDYRSQQASLFAEKLFIGDSDLVPYIGAEIGFRNSKFDDLDESGLVFGARVGARYFLTESVAIDGSLRWLLADKDVFIVDFEAEDHYVYPSFGIKAVF
jgi:hypothetical protein